MNETITEAQRLQYMLWYGRIPSKYQLDIFDEIEHGTGNVVVEAGPGSGKTWTIEQGMKVALRMPMSFRMLIGFLAYNKHIADELKRRAPPGVQVKTCHSLGLSMITRTFGRVEIDGRKMRDILDDIGNSIEHIERQVLYDLKAAAYRVISLYKSILLEVTPENTDFIIDNYNIDIGLVDDTVMMTDIIIRAMNLSKAITTVVDFDDMLWFPWIFKMEMLERFKFDIAFVDEAQDLNKVMIEVILKSVKTSGRIIAVGDRFQSIYEFRGADQDAIPNLIERLHAKVMPLKISYRLPLKHIALANTIVPIGIEPAPDAIEGSITEIHSRVLSSHIKPGDMLMCRYTAPLVPEALKLIALGVKVIIKGKDIGEGLLKVMDKYIKTNLTSSGGKVDLHSFLVWLKAWKEHEIKLGTDKNQFNRIERAIDTYDCFNALQENLSTLQQLLDRITELFSDNNAAIIFCTVHRAKGLEANRIFILLPDAIMSPRAVTPKQIQQERNCKLIAFTRSKDALYLVN